jgi:decaprenylphospho-beta-D-erythro-pentofuranosid-2-ulose 2-reductase
VNYVIIGATSAIARATARLWVTEGANFHLSARDEEALQRIRDDLLARGAGTVDTVATDLADLDSHESFVAAIRERMVSIDVVLIAHGTLPDQAACQASCPDTLSALTTNGLSHVSLLTHLANLLEQQGSGTLAVISSVAGDRGRQSNYVYGSAKSMLSAFLGGLRNRLYKSSVHVLDIRPGFVDTPMTAHLDKGPLWASPEQVAAGIVRAVSRKKDIVYLPAFWRLIMLVIRSIPEVVFKRLQL